MIAVLLLATAVSAPLETRCGWLHNPTPANWWLTDRKGQWVLQSRGSEGVAGWDSLPAAEPREWVKTNGYYGHGCACMQVRLNHKRREVLEITRLTYRPLAVCRADRRLPKP